MAKIIKLANKSEPMIKISSREWVESGLDSELFYEEDGVIKVAVGASGGISKTRAGMIAEFQDKMKKPEWRRYLLGQGYKVVKDNKTKQWRVYSSKTDHKKFPNRFIKGNALDGIMNTVNSSAAGGKPPKTPPSPVPPKPKPASGMSRALAFGGGALAGYYAGEGIAKLTQKDNTIQYWNPPEFYKGVAMLQEAVSPTGGINKTLDAYMKDVLKAIGGIASQAQKMPPGAAGFNSQAPAQPVAQDQSGSGFSSYIKD
jgi:hypothetical protein